MMKHKCGEEYSEGRKRAKSGVVPKGYGNHQRELCNRRNRKSQCAWYPQDLGEIADVHMEVDRLVTSVNDHQRRDKCAHEDYTKNAASVLSCHVALLRVEPTN